MSNVKKIRIGNVDYDIQAKELTHITYAELKELRDNSSLEEGHLYRITDYVTTTIQSNTKSVGHPFDVIVLATSESELSHLARAIEHESDTYFDGNDLGAWELWYDLDNDTTKYEWADATNGKGVIYRMIDEKRNDCPYDFKNMLFYNTKLTSSTTSDKYYYTFSFVVSGKLYDGTVEKRSSSCRKNRMGVSFKTSIHDQITRRSLNRNVWRNTNFLYGCFNNTFGDNCSYNTFGDRCSNNTFMPSFSGNTLGKFFIGNEFGIGWSDCTFGDYCSYNTFGKDGNYNTFGDNCSSNTFGNDFSYNTFGDNCSSNTFGNDFSHNTFGNDFSHNTFGNDFSYNTFGNDFSHNTFGNDFSYNTFGNSLSHHKVNGDEISITLNDEYYDDGSGKLVPIKHPDLSTQPSILPYKFMGQYVYEQLIPVKITDFQSGPVSFSTEFSAFNLDINSISIIDSNLIIFHKSTGQFGDYFRSTSLPVGGPNSDEDNNVLRWTTIGSNTAVYYVDSSTVKAYLHIVYTVIPEEDSSYYEYNNY